MTIIKRYIDGEWTAVVVGAQGETGDTGPTGPQGDQGDPFVIDAIGSLSADDRDAYDSEPEGFSFLDTDNGDAYFRVGATSGVWSDPVPFRGPEGPTGDTGDTGPQGDPGATGATGPQGIQGIQGETGEAGAKGDKGDTGDTGPGVVVGGTVGQMLAKVSSTDFHTEWVDPPEGGGGGGWELLVSSVYGTSTGFTLSDLDEWDEILFFANHRSATNEDIRVAMNFNLSSLQMHGRIYDSDDASWITALFGGSTLEFKSPTPALDRGRLSMLWRRSGLSGSGTAMGHVLLEVTNTPAVSAGHGQMGTLQYHPPSSGAGPLEFDQLIVSRVSNLGYTVYGRKYDV